VVSPEELLARVWDENVDPFANTIRMTIMKLRRKLESRRSCARGGGLPGLSSAGRQAPAANATVSPMPATRQ
jgi:hypothetical protein